MDAAHPYYISSLVPRHPPPSGHSVPGYPALLFQGGKGNRVADRAEQTSRRVDWDEAT